MSVSDSDSKCCWTTYLRLLIVIHSLRWSFFFWFHHRRRYVVVIVVLCRVIMNFLVSSWNGLLLKCYAKTNKFFWWCDFFLRCLFYAVLLPELWVFVPEWRKHKKSGLCFLYNAKQIKYQRQNQIGGWNHLVLLLISFFFVWLLIALSSSIQTHSFHPLVTVRQTISAG